MDDLTFLHQLFETTSIEVEKLGETHQLVKHRDAIVGKSPYFLNLKTTIQNLVNNQQSFFFVGSSNSGINVLIKILEEEWQGEVEVITSFQELPFRTGKRLLEQLTHKNIAGPKFNFKAALVIDEDAILYESRSNVFEEYAIPTIYCLPLKKRKEDISYFLGAFANLYWNGKASLVFDLQARILLENYDWPDNIIEVEDFIKNLIHDRSLANNVVVVEDLPVKFSSFNIKKTDDVEMILPENGIDLKNFLIKIEISLIEQALNKTQGNKKQAAHLLQLNRTTLIEKIKKNYNKSSPE